MCHYLLPVPLVADTVVVEYRISADHGAPAIVWLRAGSSLGGAVRAQVSRVPVFYDVYGGSLWTRGGWKTARFV